jgi:hypothetical protein
MAFDDDPYTAIATAGQGPGDPTPSGQSSSAAGTITRGAPPGGGDDDPYATIAKGGTPQDDDPYAAIAKGGTPSDSSLVGQVQAGVGDVVHAVMHPWETVKGIGTSIASDLGRTFLTPTEGDRNDPDPKTGLLPFPGLPLGAVVSQANMPGAQTAGEQLGAAGRTALNAGFMVAPAMSALPRLLTNAGLAAASAPSGQRIRAATAGTILGEALHRGVALGGEALAHLRGDAPVAGAVDDPYAAIATNAPPPAAERPATATTDSDPYAAIAQSPSAPVSSPVAATYDHPAGTVISSVPADRSGLLDTSTPAAPAEPIPAAPEAPPMTEIDYTGDKPVVVSAAPALPTARASRSAKIDTSIPGREKISAHDQTYARMPVSDLLDELHTQYGALDTAASNPAVGGWTRFDDDEQIMRSGSGLGAAIARQQQTFALQRVTALERELTRRGVGPDEIAEQMQLRRDRALERPLDEDEDADLSFPGSPAETDAAVPASVPGGPNVGDDRSAVAETLGAADRGPAAGGSLGLGGGLDVREGAPRPGGEAPGAVGALDAAGGNGVAAVRGASVADVPLPGDAGRGVPDTRLPLRLDKFDVDESGRTDLAAELTRLDRAGQIDKTPVSFSTMRGQAMDFATSIGADPLSVDLTKLRNLSGPEIVGLKNVVSRNTDEITTASKQLADPTLDAASKATLSDRLDALRAQRENLLTTIITNTSQRARDLGFLRQISTRSLDPDVWEIQARRVANRPLTDIEAANIRGLARTAAGICGGMAAD